VNDEGEGCHVVGGGGEAGLFRLSEEMGRKRGRKRLE